MERPSFLPQDDTRGTGHIQKDDLQMPRLALSQAMSPELQEDHGKYIEGLKSGQMYNTLSGTIYGKGPIKVTVVRADPPRWVEFIPREDGGGIKDPNVPFGDPRTQFRTDEDGKPIPPLATKFYDYVLMFLENGPNYKKGDLVALSLKSSGIKVAKALNSFIKIKRAACWAGAYELTTGTEKNTKGTFSVYHLKDAGFVSSEADYKLGESAYEALKDRTIKMDREDDDTFPPADAEM
jgi:hypothetical protein